MDGPEDPAIPTHPRTRSTLEFTGRVTGAPCQGCGVRLCGHEAVLSLVLGYKNAPRCLPCIATHMAEPAADLRARTFQYIRHHECFHTAWIHASGQEGVAEGAGPACLTQREDLAGGVAASPVSDDGATDGPATPGEVTDRWDAGGMGCGDLVLELRLRLRGLAPGGVLHLRATDPGAPIDLPAWCNLTGHTLVAAEHPEYRIRRK